MMDFSNYACREQAVRNASPVGLVILLYETIVASLLRAQEALQQNSAEKCAGELYHVLAVIGQLQATLDRQRGGEVAANLDRFYNVMRNQVLEASLKSSIPLLQELVGHFTSLKEAWQQVERSTISMPGPSPQPAAIAGGRAAAF
jgi:flagellar protein FliS